MLSLLRDLLQEIPEGQGEFRQSHKTATDQDRLAWLMQFFSGMNRNHTWIMGAPGESSQYQLPGQGEHR